VRGSRTGDPGRGPRHNLAFGPRPRGGTAPGGSPGRNVGGGRKPAPNVQAGASRRVAKARRCPRPCGRREAPSVTGARWSGGSRGTWTTAPRGVGRASGEPGSRPMLPGGQYRPAPIAAPHPAHPGGRPLGQGVGNPDEVRQPSGLPVGPQPRELRKNPDLC